MKWLLSGWFLFMYISAYAQQNKLSHIDSLDKELGTLKPGPKKDKVVSRLFFYYLNSNSQKALDIATSSLAEAERLKNDSAICVCSDYMGEAYIYLAIYKKALQYLNNDYTLAQKIGYKKQMALALCDIGSVYQNQSDYVAAQNYSIKALSLYEQMRDYRQQAVCDYNIGVVYNDQEDFKKAIYYGLQVLQVPLKSADDAVVPNAYLLIGDAYQSLRNNVEAKRDYQQALKIFQRQKNDFGIATVLSLLFATYPGDYEKQIELGSQAQLLWNRIAPDNYYSIYNLGNMGSAYQRLAAATNNVDKRNAILKKAETYLFNAIALAKKTNNKSAIIDFSDSLSVVNAAMKNYKEAYGNLNLSSKLYDSVYSQENKNKIASLEGKHEIDLKNKQLQINELVIADEHKQKWFLLSGMLALFIVAGLIYYQSNLRRKNNKLLLKLNEELEEADKIKTKFFGILNHDVRTPIANFINFMHLQQHAPDLVSESSRSTYTAKAAESAENLLNIIEDLLLWSKGQMENFKPEMTPVNIGILFAYVRRSIDDTKIKISFLGDRKMILNTDEHYIKTIMLNLTNNAIKILSNTPDAEIEWHAWTEGNKKFMSIKDNGPGASDDAFKALHDENAAVGGKNGLGLHIVRDLSKAINCKITVFTQRDRGTEITLTAES